ncbi:MAG TPA: hypothetical protein VGF56_15340 [Rhizomicrobium sp.]|jgi:hypothetical protein
MNDDNLRRGTQREWLAAKIVLVGGFVIAVAVAGYFIYRQHQADVEANQPAAPVAAPRRPEDVKTAMMLFCAQELVEGKNVNIVPVDAQLAEKLPRNTKVKNRFACIAHTTATVYFITADYRCAQVINPKCVRLYDIQTNDGLLIYRRRAS